MSQGQQSVVRRCHKFYGKKFAMHWLLIYFSRVSGKPFSIELNNYVLPFAALHHNHLIWRLGLSSLGISDNKTRITEQQISFLAFLPSTFACEVFWSPILNRALIVLDFQFLRWSVLLITAGSSCNLRHFGSFFGHLECVLRYPQQECLLSNSIWTNQKPRPQIFSFLPDFLV